VTRVRLGTLLPFVPIALGCLALWWGGRDLVFGIASAAWPLAEGRVVASGTSRTAGGADGTGTGAAGANPGAGHQARIAYVFRVDGIEHRGDTVRFGVGLRRSRDAARALAREYPVGRRVDVRHDPSNPARSVLVPGLSIEAFVVPGLGAILLTIGSAWLFVARLRRRIERMRERRRRPA